MWQHLFATKHRQNPYQERKYQGDNENEVRSRWHQAKDYIGAYQGMTYPFCINAEVVIGVSTLTTNRSESNSWSGTSCRGFVHLTLVPFPDFMPQSFDALAHEFDLTACSHLSPWELQLQWTDIGRMLLGPVQATTFHKHRKFTRARHMWLSLDPNWRLLSSHMYTD